MCDDPPPLAQCRKQPIARPATLIFNYYSRRGQNIGRERERKRWRQRQKDRGTERDRARERDAERQRKRESERVREAERERERKRQIKGALRNGVLCVDQKIRAQSEVYEDLPHPLRSR